MMKTVFRIFMALHIFFYRLTRGKFGGKVQGLPILLLTTRGRKTGKKRTTPLGYFEEDGGYVITASNAGMDTHPAWYHNLRSDPHATIEVNDRQVEVQAEVVGEEQRDRLWKKLITLSPGYAGYETKTSRKIPLVLLRPGS
jgi:deazaflavin-dependent oxidoreductase (nitroreductase family)